MDQRIPVTILTGFLGAGKTTLLNKLIKNNPDKKLAVIENEFGEINIDSDLVFEVDEGIFELSSGCICCELNGDLINVLLKLVDSERKIDHLIVETTGIADPGPVAISFLSDPQIQMKFRLDAIITLVDIQHIEQQLENHEEACKQVASADIILINKTDKSDSYQKETVINIVSRMNPLARIEECLFGKAEGIDLLNVHAFSKETIQKTNFENKYEKSKQQKFTPVSISPKANTGSLLRDRKQNSTVHSDIKSISFTIFESLDIFKFNIWIRNVLNRKFMPLYRVKGILQFYSLPEKVILQAVNNQYATEPGDLWKEGEERQSRIVLIGKNLDHSQLEKELQLCLYDKVFNPQEFYENMFNLLDEAELRAKGLL